MLELVLAVLACYRLSRLIAKDDGPGDVFLRLRAWMGAYDLDEQTGEPQGSIGRGIICPHCVGIWIAFALALLMWPIGLNTIVYCLAIAGGQSLLWSIGGERNDQPQGQ